MILLTTTGAELDTELIDAYLIDPRMGMNLLNFDIMVQIGVPDNLIKKSGEKFKYYSFDKSVIAEFNPTVVFKSNGRYIEDAEFTEMWLDNKKNPKMGDTDFLLCIEDKLYERGYRLGGNFAFAGYTKDDDLMYRFCNALANKGEFDKVWRFKTPPTSMNDRRLKDSYYLKRYASTIKFLREYATKQFTTEEITVSDIKLLDIYGFKHFMRDMSDLIELDENTVVKDKSLTWRVLFETMNELRLNLDTERRIREYKAREKNG